MATMILVEDESFERNSLMRCVDWNLIGVQIIGEAANGVQGLGLVMDLRPDIVLSDVKMPVMDGIEMARRIRQFSEDTQILFLSSYDDFEYAKQAIDLAIKAYIMKPVNEGDLLRVVKKAADEVTGNALEQRLYNKIKNNYTVSLTLARQALVNRLLTGMSVTEEDMRIVGVEWLQTGEDSILCMLFTRYDQTREDASDIHMKELNRQCAPICPQCINVCINPGSLITLCVSEPLAAERICRSLKELLDGFLEKKGFRDVRIEYACGAKGGESPAELYAEILRRNVAGYATPTEWSAKKKSKLQIVRRVEQIIEQEYRQPLTLESIAHSIHFTPNYIGAIFKTVNKVSVNRYLMRVRLEKAEELLRNSSMTVNEIAEQCGFGSITYFHTTFKKEKGVTPSEFRHGESEVT